MENIIKNDIRKEFKDDFLRYSMSVITDRALPDIRDGLKPVHRRIIYDMINDLKLKHNKPYTKSARISGDCIGKYHPHGDTSVYDAACRLTLDFVMRYPLIDGQGSFGSTDGDGAASSRYTEMRPKEIAELMCSGIDENAVTMTPNFDETLLEPSVLPSLFPNMLCNPSNGIAVALATNTAPHNLTEVCNAIVQYLNNGNMTIDEIMKYIPGPDFPLPCAIVNSKDIKKAYETGRSAVSLKIRGIYKILGNKIIFTSIPYGVTRDKIRAQVKKEIAIFETLLADFNDNSSSTINIEFELLDGVNPEIALEKIFELTDLQSTFSINNTCLVNGSPKEVSILEMIEAYVAHQHEVFTNIAKYNKQKALDKIHILKALILACANIDAVINIIREENKTRSEVKQNLKNLLNIDDVQLKAILDMRLSSLSKMSQAELENSLSLNEEIYKECQKTIDDKEYRSQKICTAVKDLSQKYGDARRTILEDREIKKSQKKKKEETIVEREVIVDIYYNGMARATTIPKKISGADWTIKAKNTDILCLFMENNLCIKIPINKLDSKLKNIFEISKVRPSKILAVAIANDKTPVTMVTKFGMIKTSNMEEYSSSRSTTIGKLRENDQIFTIILGNPKYVQLVTSDNYQLIFAPDYSAQGRNTLGVKAIKLHDTESILSINTFNDTNKEIGKRGTTGKKIK